MLLFQSTFSGHRQYCIFWIRNILPLLLLFPVDLVLQGLGRGVVDGVDGREVDDDGEGGLGLAEAELVDGVPHGGGGGEEECSVDGDSDVITLGQL